MFEKEWFPKAYSIGIGWEEFWKMNPRIILAFVEGYKEKQKIEIEQKNQFAHLQGLYFADAIASTVGNMFSRRTTKPHEYPKKPYELNSNNEQEFTEEEIIKQRELFVAGLRAKKANFDLNHKGGNK